MTNDPAPLQENHPDDHEPTPERQAQLRAAGEANVAAGNAPYAGVAIETLGELRWIVRERRWSGDWDAKGRARIDLRGATLDGAILTGASLVGADLAGASLGGAGLREVNLFEADLTRADLFRADLGRADLTGANLTGARLFRAHLAGAALYRANLAGASLAEANLAGADLSGARMDGDTTLGGAVLDAATLLGDVRWSEAPLARVDWSATGWRLGDEEAIRAAKGRKRVAACRDAARAYRGLSLALRAQGLSIPAAQYRLREQQLERSALLLEGHLLTWAGLGLLDLVAGYGERPGRIFASYVAVVLLFTGAYLAVTHLLETSLSRLSWDEALVLSLTAFHGRGFFPGSLALGDWVARLAAVEAVIGLFIELILIATFSRRFLGN